LIGSGPFRAVRARSALGWLHLLRARVLRRAGSSRSFLEPPGQTQDLEKKYKNSVLSNRAKIFLLDFCSRSFKGHLPRAAGGCAQPEMSSSSRALAGTRPTMSEWIYREGVPSLAGSQFRCSARISFEEPCRDYHLYPPTTL
jgi:hypothetical protein